ncbi:MAG: dienelactone hydrolase family protein [Gammaproteobacteria bacterium]|nr:dienelactone hydrolase family protein [Gammaproteobacteria bacterium]
MAVAPLQDAGKPELAVRWYEADHAFPNPTSARYDADDAALSRERTVEFFRQNLG